MLLGVNIDHIAVLREARRVADPNLIDALGILQRAGANQVTIHLREDRRHIQDGDVRDMIALSPLPINLECAISSEIIDIVATLRPHRATIVPEKREEVTTEGGLDVVGAKDRLKESILKLQREEIEVSLFIDPDIDTLETSKELGVEWVEFHTGKYANIYAMLYGNLSKTHHTIRELELPRARLKEMLDSELETLRTLCHRAKELGLRVAVGHGLNYQNVRDIVAIESIEELNIGQSIIARSIYIGLERAIVDMRNLTRR
jgi:pyridoxine 5-phosphate synthase